MARRLAEHLRDEGYLLTAHANVLSDEPDQPGFDWGHPFGAKRIGEVFAQSGPLQPVKEFRTPLYRIHLFQRLRSQANARWAPEIITSTQMGSLTPEAAAFVRWGNHTEKPTSVNAQLPILMYHRIASDGSPKLGRYRVAPEQFREQLAYLRSHGYYSVRLQTWAEAIATRSGLAGNPILITFDDGYRDFKTYAAPALWYYGFSAAVFLVADAIGGSATWDSAYGSSAPLLDWPEIRQLEQQGISFGSHFLRHVPLTGLPMEAVVREGTRAMAIMERELREPLPAIAYPHGDYDLAVAHALRACGYEYGLTCRPWLSQIYDHPMELPRIEIAATDDLKSFAAKLRGGGG